MSTCKERQAKRRAKIKQNKELYQAYLESDKKRKAARRATLKSQMSAHQLEEHRVKERMRVRKYREKKRLETPQSTQAESSQPSTSTPYRTYQSLGKAVKRAQVSLPSSPRKKRCVIENLAKKAGLSIASSSPSQKRGLSEETKGAVNAFYLNNDITWQAPGRKDRVIIREVNSEGKMEKRTEQTRYMLMSLNEAYTKFIEEHPSHRIGLSKFCELRPKNVKLFDHIPHHVCVCSYHENVRLLLVALREHTSLAIEFHDFISQVTCDPNARDCLSSQCKNCQDQINRFAPSNGSDTVRYLQWQNNERVEKVEIIGTVEDAFGELKKQLKPFLMHTYIKRKQAAYLDTVVSKCNGNQVVLQVDFSENATIASQREIQSAHWSHAQATIFTAHAWIDSDSSESMVLVSDDLNHSKQSVYVFMQYIFNHLKSKCPDMKVINIFSDGASSQFKQKFLFSNLYAWEQEHDLTIIWNFFATSHGKGVVDGIGGTVKRAVWRHIRSDQTHVTNAEQYAAVARQRCPSIHVSYIKREQIESLKPFLDEKWSNVVAVPRTHQTHCFKTSGKEKLMVADISMSTAFRIVRIRKASSDNQEESGDESDEKSDKEDSHMEDDSPDPPDSDATTRLTLSVGQWVLVRYDGLEFPGEVTSCSETDAEVNVMHRSGSAWRWPTNPDKIFYERANILRQINPPKAAGHRGQFTFDDI